jgi:hypothetical protein
VIFGRSTKIFPSAGVLKNISGQTSTGFSFFGRRILERESHEAKKNLP